MTFEQTACLSVTGYSGQVAEWKFDQLDSDRDGVLKKKELKAFRGDIKKVLRPRRCGSSFTRYDYKNFFHLLLLPYEGPPSRKTYFCSQGVMPHAGCPPVGCVPLVLACHADSSPNSILRSSRPPPLLVLQTPFFFRASFFPKFEGKQSFWTKFACL